MKYKRLLLPLLFSISSIAAAQFKTIAEGPEFKEYDEGYSKVLQLKNGNTIFLNFNVHTDIDVQLYDASFKRTIDKKVKPLYGKLRGGDIDAVFEAGGDVTVLLSERTEQHPILRRLIIDSKTGAIKKEEVVLDLDKRPQRKKRYWNKGSGSDFTVVKDPYSECYAVYTMKNDGGKEGGFEYIHFGPDHKIISRADGPSEEQKGSKTYYSYKDMVVMGDDKVYVLAYTATYNEKDVIKSEALTMMVMDKGSNRFRMEPLKFPKPISNEGLARFNPHTRQIILMQSNAYLGFYNLDTKGMEPARQLSTDRADVKSKELFGRKDGFQGIPQNVFFRRDGAFAIVFEEYTNEIGAGNSPNGRSTGSRTVLGDIAVMSFDKNGKETGLWYTPKQIGISDMRFPYFYHKARENTAEWMEIGNQYRFFNFLSSPTTDYLLFNDRQNSRKKIAKGDVDIVWLINKCRGFYVKPDGKNIMPDRIPVFGDPADDDSEDVGIFIISDYDPANNRYVTVRTSPGRGAKSRLVWMNPL